MTANNSKPFEVGDLVVRKFKSGDFHEYFLIVDIHEGTTFNGLCTTLYDLNFRCKIPCYPLKMLNYHLLKLIKYNHIK